MDMIWITDILHHILQIKELPMNITNDIYLRIDVMDIWLLYQMFYCFVGEVMDL